MRYITIEFASALYYNRTRTHTRTRARNRTCERTITGRTAARARDCARTRTRVVRPATRRSRAWAP